MLGVWIAYVTLATALLVLAARLVERALNTGRRWLWGTVMLAAPLVPVVHTLAARLAPRGSALDVVFGPVAPVWGTALKDLGTVASTSPLLALEGYLVLAWAVAGVSLMILLVVGTIRIRRLRKGWSAAVVDGVPVLLSRGFGPAVIGLRRPEIVLPPWVLELAAEERRLVLAHEEEHRRRGDPGLLAAAFGLVAAMPWNVPAWWALFRLRDAVETDCDARVLAGHVGSRSRYARLLFDVGSRASGVVPLGAGFGERVSSLERRIKEMLSAPAGRRRLLLQAAVAAVLVVAACTIEVNIDARGDDANQAAAAATTTKAPVEAPEAAVPSEARAEAGKTSPKVPPTPVVPKPTPKSVASRPTFTPYTVAPTILNRDEVIKALEENYPPLLRDAGIGGTVRVYFFIDETGKVLDHRIDKSSGHAALDDAALRVAGVYRFSPALNRDKKVPVWVSFPITFQMR
ncbi:MAG: M56 family metallopeptidase [Gemmatimonadetes bacterium]|nr:M56 family metallopeptidase [Gemmatimonadota bacterium]